MTGSAATPYVNYKNIGQLAHLAGRWHHLDGDERAMVAEATANATDMGLVSVDELEAWAIIQDQAVDR